MKRKEEVTLRSVFIRIVIVICALLILGGVNSLLKSAKKEQVETWILVGQEMREKEIDLPPWILWPWGKLEYENEIFLPERTKVEINNVTLLSMTEGYLCEYPCPTNATCQPYKGTCTREYKRMDCINVSNGQLESRCDETVTVKVRYLYSEYRLNETGGK